MSNKHNQTVIGIDIGASTAKIAALQRGAVDILTNEANFRETPVIVGFGDGERKIGEIGNAKLKSNYKNTVVSPLRYLGLGQDNQAVRKQVANSPCETHFEEGHLSFKVDANGIKQSFTPEQIVAAFMTQISEIINLHNLDDKQIVIAVPSYFTEIQKKALLNAAEISGTKNVKLITDTFAIGLDYATQKKSELAESRNVVFVDFGHSKLSLTLINLNGSKIGILLQKSNRNLGCRDIDQNIFSYIARKFQKKSGLNIRQNKKACLKLNEVIQRQRKILSGITQSQISIQCLMEDEDLLEPFTRQIMLNEASSVFQEIKGYLASFKQEMEGLNIKIDAIQLVGGGSRIPKVIELVQQTFGVTASRTINSSETIARGATLAAIQKSGLFRFQNFQTINRSAHTIKVSWNQFQSNQNDYASLNSQTLIQINQPLPAEKSLKLKANKAELTVSYDLLNQQIEKKIKTYAYETALPETTQVSLNFRIDQDGFVKLLSVKNSIGEDIKFTTKSYKILTAQQISKFKAKQRQMFVKDFAIVKGYEKKNQLESFIYKQKQSVNGSWKFLLKQEIKQFQVSLDQLVDQLNDTHEKFGMESYQTMKKQVEDQVRKMAELVSQRKNRLEAELKKLENLKLQAIQTMKQISQRYRNTRQVVDIYNKIKQIQVWAQQAIQLTKSKQITEIPAIDDKDVNQQHENIRALVNQLIKPRKPQPQPRSHQYQYQPQQYLNYSNSKPLYSQNRKQRQQCFDPFGMFSSGLYSLNNMFGFF